MRLGQGMPVNMIVLTALALLVLVVVGAFFISGFGQAGSSINIVEASQAECSGICQSLVTTAFNYNSCSNLNDDVNQAITYGIQCAPNYGACTVTLRNGDSCSIDVVACDDETDCTVVGDCTVPTCTSGYCVCVSS
ncbi:MAG: hypothetical protein WC307_03990 [Candidatus Nanoarchaeia archaeon]|jgi:hypothetical protein